MRSVLSVGIAGLFYAVVAAGGARSAVAEPNLLLSYSIDFGGIRVMDGARSDDDKKSDFRISAIDNVNRFVATVKNSFFRFGSLC